MAVPVAAMRLIAVPMVIVVEERVVALSALGINGTKQRISTHRPQHARQNNHMTREMIQQ